MAANDRRSAASIIDRLVSTPYRFDFYQAVKLLELVGRRRAPSRRGATGVDVEETAVGRGVYPELESVRFRTNIDRGFPASSIQSIDAPSEHDAAYTMVVNFLGLTGANGPLPTPYAELVAERVARHDDGFRDFLDIFNHRLVSLMWRIRRKHRFTLDTASPEKNAFAGYLYSLFGLGTAAVRQRLEVPDRALLYYTGLLAQQPRSMTGLERLLSDYFGVPAKCLPMKGGWYELAEDQLTRIGTRGKNQHLGRGAVLGTRTWSQNWRFEIELGPMGIGKYRELLPLGAGYPRLCSLIRFYVGSDLDFGVRLKLEAAEVPDSHLGLRPVSNASEKKRPLADEVDWPRLGWTSFVRKERDAREDGEVLIRPGFVAANSEWREEGSRH
jgi:type VI secretion system protein ImpH